MNYRKHINCQILFDSRHGTLIRTEEAIFFTIHDRTVIIPRGYISDGMSVPRLLWRLLSPPINGETLIPSIIHDWLYDSLYCSRFEADLHYYHDLLANGFPKWKAVLTFIGVRLFGGSHRGNK